MARSAAPRSGAATSRGPAAGSRQSRPARVKPQRQTKGKTPRGRGRAGARDTGQRQIRASGDLAELRASERIAQIAQQGYETDATQHPSGSASTSIDPPSGREILGGAVEAAAELAQLGLTVGGQLVRSAVSRLPRP